MRFSLFLGVSLLVSPMNTALAAPKVTASIVPVHGLVASVMDGVGEPALLLRGQNSEHQASYTPEQVKLLADSDLVFIIGKGLELKLDEMNGSETVKGKSFIELSRIEGLTKYGIRKGGAWAADDHDHGPGHSHDDQAEMTDEQGHDEHIEEQQADPGPASFDPHLWLDPENAKMMLTAIAVELAKADPGNAIRYEANAKAAAAELDKTSAEISAKLAPAKDKPYVVFHDAYRYFEERFGLSPAGSISDFSASAPSAKRLKEVRAQLQETNARCVFREPQFSDKAVKIVIEGTGAREGVLDPIGATLTPGKGAYNQLLMNLSQGFADCLTGK